VEAVLVEPCAVAVLDAHLRTVEGLAICEHMCSSSSVVSSVSIILLLVEEDALGEDAATWKTRRPHLQLDAVFFIPFQIRDLVAAVAAAIDRPLPLRPRPGNELTGRSKISLACLVAYACDPFVIAVAKIETTL
jgi:hypothetical protein